MRLQPIQPSPAIAVNITLFSALPHDNSTSGVALGRQIATSGGYVDGTDSPAGVTISQTKLKPGRYYVVASTFDPGLHTNFQLFVFTSVELPVMSLDAQ